MAAKRSIVRALDVLRERKKRQELEPGCTRTASKGRGHPVTGGGQPGGWARCTGDQGDQAEEDSGYRAGTAEETGDGCPSVGFARTAGKPAAAYTGG